MWSASFWVDVVERAVKTFAQAAVAVLGADASGVLDVDFVAVLSVAGLAALVSVATSIGSAPLSNPGTASLTDKVKY